MLFMKAKNNLKMFDNDASLFQSLLQKSVSSYIISNTIRFTVCSGKWTLKTLYKHFLDEQSTIYAIHKTYL